MVSSTPSHPAPVGTSSPRYTVLLVLGGTLRGCSPSSSTANLALNRKKSISSAAASISAWITVFPCEAGGPGAQQWQTCPVSPHRGPCAHSDIMGRVLAAPAQGEYMSSLGLLGQEPGSLAAVNISLDCLFFPMVNVNRGERAVGMGLSPVGTAPLGTRGH